MDGYYPQNIDILMCIQFLDIDMDYLTNIKIVFKTITYLVLWKKSLTSTHGFNLKS
jgi:hypothetical protein